MSRWKNAELAALHRLYPDTPTANIAAKLRRPISAIYQRAKLEGLSKSAAYLASPSACRLRRGDQVGKAWRYPKGHVPANKGLRRPGWAPGRMRETQFKKGCMSGAAQHNYVPIGSTRISKEGYLERKTTDAHPVPARRWVGVHRLVWEAANGPIPAGHAVVFLKDRQNTDESKITLDALELVSRAELMRRNSYHRYGKEIARVVQLRGALTRQINKRTKSA